MANVLHFSIQLEMKQSFAPDSVMCAQVDGYCKSPLEAKGAYRAQLVPLHRLLDITRLKQGALEQKAGSMAIRLQQEKATSRH